MKVKYKRILLKLSGESLMGEQKFGIEASMLRHYAEQIQQLVEEGIEVAVVIGGGNIFRGLSAEKSGIERVQGDSERAGNGGGEYQINLGYRNERNC
jgi:uridylate kinase